jgi:hypothetical protein
MSVSCNGDEAPVCSAVGDRGFHAAHMPVEIDETGMSPVAVDRHRRTFEMDLDFCH